MFTTKHYSFFWESFLIKTHKHIFEALCDLIDTIHLFYQNQFPVGVLKKNWSRILVSKIIWCLFKNDIFDILLVEWQVNKQLLHRGDQTLKRKRKKKWINTLTPWLLNNVFLNVWIMVCSELVAHNSWNASLQRLNHLIRWGQSLLITAACTWNEERPSLLFLSRSEISTSLAIPFWAWIIFLS